MAKNVKNKKKESVIKQLLWRAFGLLLIVFCILAIFGVCFYHPEDNSFNYASSNDVQNYLEIIDLKTLKAFIYLYNEKDGNSGTKPKIGHDNSDKTYTQILE